MLEYSTYTEGEKVKIIGDINTVDGTLYKGSIVKVDEIGTFPDKDVRVKDNVGKIWYIDYIDIAKIQMLTDKQQQEIQELIAEISETANDDVDDYKKIPSEVSGSEFRVYEDSPYLDERFSDSQWKKVLSNKNLNK